MKSIKPGRGPSMMGGVASVVISVFGVFWVVMTARMGAPFFFPLFGVAFVLLGIMQAVYHFHNATGENRHSIYDITDSREEPDPLDPRHSRMQDDYERPAAEPRPASGYCPYCGAVAGSDYTYCRQCGKKL